MKHPQFIKIPYLYITLSLVCLSPCILKRLYTTLHLLCSELFENHKLVIRCFNFLTRISTFTVVHCYSYYSWSVYQKSILMLKRLSPKKEERKPCIFHIYFLQQWYLNQGYTTSLHYTDVRALKNPAGTRSSRGSAVAPSNRGNFIPGLFVVLSVVVTNTV